MSLNALAFQPLPSRAVLNGEVNVSEDLSQQVRQAIQDLGYRPNRTARHLRAGRVKKIGVVFADIRNPFFTSILAGIESVLWQDGYVLLLGNSDEDSHLEQIHLETLIEEGVAGVILAAVTDNPARYQPIQRLGTALLFVDRIPSGLRADSIVINHTDAAIQATDHLIAVGHRRIAFISGMDHLSTARDRLLGYELALRQHGRAVEPALVIKSNFRQDGGLQAMKHLLAMPERPDAVLVANNLMTLGAFQAINEAGLNIPSDIAILGFDDMPWATSMQPPLTVIAQPTHELGTMAGRMLLERIRNPEHPIQKVMLDAELVVRQSCGSKEAESGPA